MFEKRAYLLDVTNRTPTKRSLQELVDILCSYRYNEFIVYRDSEAAERFDPARLKAYCEMQGVELVFTKKYDCEELFFKDKTMMVSSEASRSLCGRVEEMRERMIAAEARGRADNFKRFCVTDFSDGYEWQPMIVSLPAIVMGGNFAASGAKAANMDLERELDRVLDAPLAGYLLKLGTLYLRGGAMRDGESEYFNILAGDAGYSRHPGITQQVLDEVSGIARGIAIAAERWTDRNDRAKEIVYMAKLLDAACHRRQESMLRELRDDHGRIWRMLFEPEGRAESLSKLPRF